MGIFSKLKQAWFGDVNWEKLDDEFFDNLEESLILADVGVNIAAESVNSLRNAVFSYDMKDPEQVRRSCGRYCCRSCPWAKLLWTPPRAPR